MIATLTGFWPTANPKDTTVPRPPKPARAPLFIGDVAMVHGRTTELHWQLRRDDDGPHEDATK